jgi:hypothetical protein
MAEKGYRGAMAGKVRRLEDRPLSDRRAKDRIYTLWKTGFVEIWPHAQDRMRERKIDTTDIEHVLRYGHVVENNKPGLHWRSHFSSGKMTSGHVVENNKPGLHWRYKVKGTSVDGDQMACVVEINGNLIIVTVEWL